TYIWKAGGNDIQSGTQTNFPLSIDSLAPGNYSVVVIDGNGCIDSLDFNIIQPNTPLEALIQSTQNVDCFGNANGALTGAGVGGTPPYVFSITGGFSYQVSPVFSGLGATQYTLQVRDGNGCIATITDTLTSPTGLFGSLLGKKDVRCFGLSDGFIEIAGAGGTQPYTLSLDGNSFFNSLSLNSLGPGQDTVLMQDANSCVVAIPFEIFEPPALSGSPIYSQNINCFGFQTGIIELKASGGSLPYTFSVDGSNYQSDSLFTGLPAGSYQTVVQDDSLCQDTIPIVLTEPNELELANLDQKNIDCFGNTNGAVLTDATGGTGPYTFTMDSLNFQATGFFDTLTVGSYVVTVVDDSSCVTRLPVQITEPPLLEIRIQDLANVACFGDSTGFVGLEATGGSPAYTYSLDSLDFQNDPLFPQLAAGTYSFWVMDDSSCVTRVDTEITESLLLEFSLVNQVNIDCFGNDNGAVAFSVEGGVPAYALSLDGGMPQSSLLFENLSPGLHEVVVTDDSACTQSLTVDIFEPPLLTLSMEKTDVTCFDFADGSATVIADGGTPEFRYHWSTVPTQTAAQATNLSGGTYQVIVTDANGCSDTASSFIFEPDSLTLTLDPNAVVESYCDWPNGSAAVFTSGGRLPHTISWNGRNSLEGASVDELYGGPYQVTVTDSVGCVTRLDVDIPETPPAIPLFESNPSWREAILLSQASLQFDNQSLFGVAYFWDFGDNTQSDEENPSHTYQEKGLYSVTLTAYNSYFVCPTETTVLINIIPDGSLFIPNVFTPNGDNRNDFFFVGGEGMPIFQLEIFDQWGRSIKSFESFTDRWDGNNKNGYPMPEGVYVYRVQGVFNDGQKIERAGTITLVR
ncbi:MAG: gliding motility-associated C-terminal domain-containing protein, partial [Bacteroidota bacterium]